MGTGSYTPSTPDISNTMTKWTGPLQPPPFWLVAACEVTDASEPPKLEKAPFVLRCLTALTALGCSVVQAVEVTANSVNETGWGQHYRAWNLGGWKIWKFSAQNANGSPRRWWRALGNQSSGDPQTCFYRAFQSPEEFFAEWLRAFVPKDPTAGKKNARYAKTGQQFWAGQPWFDDLIAAGYKGDVTQANPDRSIAEHAKLVDTIAMIWAQAKIGAEPDGSWGPKSAEKASAFQSANGLPVTGKFDAETKHFVLHGVKLPPPPPPPPKPEPKPEPKPKPEPEPVPAKESKRR